MESFHMAKTFLCSLYYYYTQKEWNCKSENLCCTSQKHT